MHAPDIAPEDLVRDGHATLSADRVNMPIAISQNLIFESPVSLPEND
jgi:hypothetical protein